MTIKIVAKGICRTFLDTALDHYDATIDMGFNGSYSISYDEKNENFELDLTLEVDSMIPEVRKMRKTLRQYITDFECTGNVVTNSKPIAVENETETVEEKSTTSSEESPTVEAVMQEVKEVLPEVSISLFFQDISGNNIEEVSDKAIDLLFNSTFRHGKTFDTFKTLISSYAKADTKPKSFNALCVMANKKVSPTTVKKVNQLIQQRFGINTFMEFLKYLPKFAEDETTPSDPEEVILEKPKKPPKRKNIAKVPISKEELINTKMKNLDYYIKSIPKNTTITESVKLLISKMNTPYRKNDNLNFIKKLFCSVLFFKEASIEKLFNQDVTLKRFGTLAGAKSILKELLEKFFKTDITNEDLEKFFHELILSFFGTTKESLTNISVSQEHIVKKTNSKQNPGVMRCFPKNEKFDNFLKVIFCSKSSRKSKVKRILDYMGLKNLSSNEIEIIEKLCIKHLYMLEFHNPEQNYTEQEKIILEEFVNNFAKTLVENANFITLKEFIRELSKIPVSY